MTAIDAADDRILQVLAKDGRITNAALASRVGLSPSTCFRRVERLERAGVIRGYRAVIDPAARDLGFLAYVAVGLNRHTRDAQAAFEREVARVPAIRECHNVTGGVEYLLRVEVRDLAAYKEVHTEVLGALPQVRSLVTYVVMSSPRDDRA